MLTVPSLWCWSADTDLYTLRQATGAHISFMGKEAGHGPLISTAGFGSGLCGVVMSGASGGDSGHLVRTCLSVAMPACLLADYFGGVLEAQPVSPQ